MSDKKTEEYYKIYNSHSDKEADIYEIQRFVHNGLEDPFCEPIDQPVYLTPKGFSLEEEEGAHLITKENQDTLQIIKGEVVDTTKATLPKPLSFEYKEQNIMVSKEELDMLLLLQYRHASTGLDSPLFEFDLSSGSFVMSLKELNGFVKQYARLVLYEINMNDSKELVHKKLLEGFNKLNRNQLLIGYDDYPGIGSKSVKYSFTKFTNHAKKFPTGLTEKELVDLIISCREDKKFTLRKTPNI